MANKTLTANYKEHVIKATVSKSNGCSMFVDDVIVAKFTEKVPSGATSTIMKTTIEAGGKDESLEVHARNGIRLKAKICVDGRRIYGDEF